MSIDYHVLKRKYLIYNYFCHVIMSVWHVIEEY